MSFSLIYICCSFRGGILSVVFPAVARCFWPAGNLECPCLFSDLILFPFLLLFFYIVPYSSFSSMFFSLIYICCSFRGGILSAKYFSFIVLRHRSWGLPFGEPEKLIFLMQYKKKLIISGDLFFFLKRSSLGTSDIQGCYSPKGITYMIYTLIHGRDPIPWRITYIEFRSAVKIFINF